MGEVQSEAKRWSRPVLEIVGEFFPGVSDEDAESILWERTGWPAFWDGDPETVLRRQLQELKDAPDGRLCDFCNKIAAEDDTLCEAHRDDWKRLRYEDAMRDTYESLAFARGRVRRFFSRDTG